MADELLASLCGKRLETVEHPERGAEWRFGFAGGYSLNVGGPWRLVAGGEVRLGSEDHRQQFGLPQPLHAHACLAEFAVGRCVESVATSTLGDLHVHLGEGASIEVFNESCGYEG